MTHNANRSICTKCPKLVASRNRIVWGEIHSPYSDPHDPKLMAIAEAPGYQEDKSGRPLIGVSGKEARHMLDVNGISKYGIWLDNSIKCHPDNDRDPTKVELANCLPHLTHTIQTLRPVIIITMGAIASRNLLGRGISMELDHGIPRVAVVEGQRVVAIPVYHPAAGLRDNTTMIQFQMDMKVAGQVARLLLWERVGVEGISHLTRVTDDVSEEYVVATAEVVDRVFREQIGEHNSKD